MMIDDVQINFDDIRKDRVDNEYYLETKEELIYNMFKEEFEK